MSRVRSMRDRAKAAGTVPRTWWMEWITGKLIIEIVKQKNPKDRYMYTPFDCAIQKGHTLVANFLEKYARRTKKRKITD